MEGVKEDTGSGEEEVFHEYLERTAVEESEGMPLLRAARTGDFDSLQFLLAGDDIDVNQQDYRGMAALHHAAAVGDEEAARELLQHPGIQIELTDRCGSTPLHHAALYRHAPLLTMLLEAGANINAQKANGRTALHEAAWINHLDILEVLIEADADPQILEANHRTASQLARMNHADPAADRIDKYIADIALREYNEEMARRTSEWQKVFVKATSKRRDCGATSPRKKKISHEERLAKEKRRADREQRRAERRKLRELQERALAEIEAAQKEVGQLEVPESSSMPASSVCSYSMSDSELSARGLVRGTFVCKCPYCAGFRRAQESDEWDAAKQAQLG